MKFDRYMTKTAIAEGYRGGGLDRSTKVDDIWNCSPVDFNHCKYSWQWSHTRFSVSVTDQLGLLLRHQWINQSIVQFVSHTSRVSNPRRVTLGSADDRSYVAGTAGQARACAVSAQSNRQDEPDRSWLLSLSSTPALLWPRTFIL